MKQKQIEKQSLIISSIVNFIIAIAGFWAYKTTGIQALFLDFFFSLISFISLIFATIISNYSHRKTKIYPEGQYFLEPFYAIVKSLLIIGLLVASVWSTFKSAMAYFFDGVGEVMNVEPVLPYTILMIFLCFGLAGFNYAQNKKINQVSVLLNTESKSNLIDGLQSMGIGVAVILLMFVNVDGPLGFLHYTGDFFITTFLALISIKEPLKLIGLAFIELSRGTSQDKNVNESIDRIIKDYLGNLSTNLKYYIFKTGTKIKIEILVSNKLQEDQKNLILQSKEKLLSELKKLYDNVDITYQL